MIKKPTLIFFYLIGSVLWIGCDSKAEKKDVLKTNKDSIKIDVKEEREVLLEKKAKVKQISLAEVKQLASVASEKVMTDLVYRLTESALKIPGVPNQVFYIDDANETELVNDTYASNYLNYGLSWINLSNGPVVVTVPEGKKEYYLVSVFNLNQEVIWTANSRRNQSGDFIFVPVNYTGDLPEDMTVIRCRESICFLEGRFSNNDPNLFKGLVVRSLTETQGGADPFKNYRPSIDLGSLTLESFYNYSGSSVRLEVFDSASQKILIQQYEAFLKKVEDYRDQTLKFIGKNHQMGAYIRKSKRVGSWEVGPLGDHKLSDIGVAISMKDEDGEELNGVNSYKISFSSEASPEVYKTGFWELSIYDLEGNIMSSPYSVSSLSNLSFNSNMSLDIQLSNKKSKFTPKSNWISTKEKPFKVVLRIYNPNIDHYEEQWTLPIIIKKNK